MRRAPAIRRSVDVDGRREIVYVAGTGGRWASGTATCSGRAEPRAEPSPRGRHGSLTAPMPATVIKVLVAAGDAVKKGDTWSCSKR